jgi:hypothetical protein
MMTNTKCLALAALLAGGCGTSLLGNDGGTTNDDLATQLYRLQSGTYKATSLTNLNDGCMVNPNDPMNPTVNTVMYTLTNDGMGNIGLGTVGGTPPQPSNGASCPGSPANAACSTATNPLPFNNNVGTLVRDNTINDTTGGGSCMEHRHVENLIMLTADNTFTASYTRKDTMHTGCTATADCTTTWTWTLVKQ